MKKKILVTQGYSQLTLIYNTVKKTIKFPPEDEINNVFVYDGKTGKKINFVRTLTRKEDVSEKIVATITDKNGDIYKGRRISQYSLVVSEKSPGIKDIIEILNPTKVEYTITEGESYQSVDLIYVSESDVLDVCLLYTTPSIHCEFTNHLILETSSKYKFTFNGRLGITVHIKNETSEELYFSEMKINPASKKRERARKRRSRKYMMARAAMAEAQEESSGSETEEMMIMENEMLYTMPVRKGIITLKKGLNTFTEFSKDKEIKVSDLMFIAISDGFCSAQKIARFKVTQDREDELFLPGGELCIYKMDKGKDMMRMNFITSNPITQTPIGQYINAYLGDSGMVYAEVSRDISKEPLKVSVEEKEFSRREIRVEVPFKVTQTYDIKVTNKDKEDRYVWLHMMKSYIEKVYNSPPDVKYEDMDGEFWWKIVVKAEGSSKLKIVTEHTEN